MSHKPPRPFEKKEGGIVSPRTAPRAACPMGGQFFHKPAAEDKTAVPVERRKAAPGPPERTAGRPPKGIERSAKEKWPVKEYWKAENGERPWRKWARVNRVRPQTETAGVESCPRKRCCRCPKP